MLAGPTSRATVMEFEQGARARIGDVRAGRRERRFTGPSLPAIRDELVPLEILWGRSGACLRERLLEAGTAQDAFSVMEDVLLRQLTGPMAPDRAVIAAAGALSRGVRVGQVADDLGPWRASPRASTYDPASTDPTTCGLSRNRTAWS
jgi:hypothetical protein